VKKLYKITVRNFVPYGGNIIVYFVWAYSEAQAKKVAAIKFNKTYGFTPDSFVEMKIKEIKPG